MIISIITLGCKVNEYESQSMMTQLMNEKYEVVEGLVPADVYILNTCAVTNMAERKSRQMIAKITKLNPNAKIVVSGCASQNNKDQFLQYDNVYSVLGNQGKQNIVSFIKEMQKDCLSLPLTYENFAYATSTKARQYIKIQDGCDNFCTYCIIPYTRGRSRSRDLQDIISEIKECKTNEIVLTGIDVSNFKIDGRLALIDLMEEIDKCGKRFRLSSIECNIMTDEFLNRLKNLKNFCPHFHISMQSACNETLKRMNRHYSIEKFIKITKKINKMFKNACISTDIIVGFKGETDKEFNETFKNIKKIPFAFLHIFPYSVRKGTIAEKFDNDVPKDVVSAREKLLQDYSDKIYQKFVKKNIGKTHKILVEEYKDDMAVGYTENYLYTYCKEKLPIGGIENVKVIKPYQDGVLVEKVEN